MDHFVADKSIFHQRFRSFVTFLCSEKLRNGQKRWKLRRSGTVIGQRRWSICNDCKIMSHSRFKNERNTVFDFICTNLIIEKINLSFFA